MCPLTACWPARALASGVREPIDAKGFAREVAWVPGAVTPPPGALVTSPLEGEVGSRGKRASREGSIGSAESNSYPPPHPSPSRGEGAGCGSVSAQRPGLSNLLDRASAGERLEANDIVRLFAARGPEV